MSPIAVPPPKSEPVDRRVTTYLTATEQKALIIYASRNGLSMSAAARRMIKRGLDQEPQQ